MPLTHDQRCEVDKLTELRIRQYLDALHERTLPNIIGMAVRAHDSDIEAHKVLFRRQWSTLKLALVAFATGGGFAGLSKLLGAL